MKKWFSLFLALVMLMPVAAAWGEADTSEPVTLTIMCQSNVQTIDAAEMGMFKAAAAAANVNLEWTQVRSGWSEKKAVLLASDDYPDIFFSGLDTADITMNLEAFTDMTDLINEYAPNVARMFEEVPDAKVSGTYGDGGIYSLPRIVGYRPRTYCTIGLNKVWLDKLGLEIPTTLDELEQVLIAFRDGDPNGNGLKDEIGFDWPNVGYCHDAYELSGAFGVVDCQDTYRTVIQDGKISFLYEQDAYYKLTQYLHRWYQEGLITPEVFTNDYAASNALCGQGEVARVGMVTGYSAEARTGSFAREYVHIAPLSGGEEYKTMWPFMIANRTIAPNACVLSASCENKERAMAFINELYSDDFGVQCYFGSFDTGLTTKNEDGTYTINMPTDYASIEESKWVYSLVDYTPGYFAERVEAVTTAPAELTGRIEVDNIYVPYMAQQTDIWPTLIKFSEEELEELTYIRSDIFSYVNQKTAEWIVNGGIEEEWDEFQKYLESLGIDTMREIYQKAYDAYYASI
jgi:putative aldouronate transport system substrate-binding protein